MRVEPYPETHMTGNLSIERNLEYGIKESVDVGIQISRDGRIWVCVNGAALIRFKPTNNSYITIEGKSYNGLENISQRLVQKSKPKNDKESYS